MREIVSSDYSIWIGENSLSKLNVKSYSKVAILVDENTKINCLEKIPKIDITGNKSIFVIIFCSLLFFFSFIFPTLQMAYWTLKFPKYFQDINFF